MPLTLAQLRTAEGTTAIKTRLLTNLDAAGMPIEDWIPSAQGGVEMIRVEAVASALQRLLAVRVAQLANLMLLELAPGPTDADPRDHLGLYAEKRYKTTREPATKTIQSMAFWMVGTPSAKTLRPGDVIVASSATGNRYVLIDEVKIGPPNTALNPVFGRCEAEQAGTSYADSAETVTTMVTALAGVRCANRRSADFLPASLTGFSSGTVTAFFDDPDNAPTIKSIRIRIEADGNIGTSTFSYSLNEGQSWTFSGATGTTNIGGFWIVAFTNGTTPSFLAGDVFTLLLANQIVQRGADAETNEALRRRCRLRWMTLSDVPLSGTIDLWAHLASPEVDRVLSDADPNTPGSILVTISAASGEASPSACLAVGDYISPRLNGYKNLPAPAGLLSPEERVLVSSAKRRDITGTGTVQVPRANIAAVQLAAETAWLAYLRSVPLGGDTGAIVRLTELVQAVMDAGAVDFLAPTLNGAAANVSLLHGEVAVQTAGQTLVTSLIWSPV